MGDIDAPSFSLGIDLDDLDADPQIPAPRPSSCAPAPARPPQLGDCDDDFQAQAGDSDPELVESASPLLRRLKRGPQTEPAPPPKQQLPDFSFDLDDEIEEFSSQEKPRGRKDDCFPTQYQSVCSTSKFPLHGHGVSTMSHSRARRRDHVPGVAASSSLEIGNKKLRFPNPTISPLRRFQLIDSDSDAEDLNRVTIESDQPLQQRQYMNATVSDQKRKSASACVDLTKDMWEDFCPVKKFSVSTPALDEVCDEYFRAQNVQTGIKNKGPYQTKKSTHVEQQWAFVGSLPPAHRYYFHEDRRIQELVRSRFPNFFPLSALNSKENSQLGQAAIDYLNQFRHDEGSKSKAAGSKRGENSKLPAIKEVSNDLLPTKGRKKSNKSSVLEASMASGSWVSPSSSTVTPKNAGKQRIQAEGHSSGHWYTGQDGRRVYVTKNGQELTGQVAYRHYRKESGAGFKKSKKKVIAKKTKNGNLHHDSKAITKRRLKKQSKNPAAD